MASFSYRAIDADGVITEGDLDASNELALEAQLLKAGIEVMRCTEKRSGLFSRKAKVSRKELIGFCFHMEQMTRAGLPILEALTDLRDSVGNAAFSKVIANVIASVEAGKTMSEAVAEFPNIFDDVFVSLIAVGEESGELPDVMHKLTESLKWQDEILSKAKSVILYPAFVGIVVLGVMLFMMLYVVPQMVDFIREMGQDLPIHTRALIAFSAFLTTHWWWAVPLPGVIIWLIKIQADRNEKVRYIVDGWKLNAWYIGPIQTKLILSRFASYFALCYSSGLDVLASLKISEEIAGNAVIRRGIEQISQNIGDGKALSASIQETKLFPPLVVRMVRMGESTGLLDNALSNVSYFYDREVTESIDTLKAMIEPAMTVILGAILGWIMLSVLGPIYETISSIGV